MLYLMARLEQTVSTSRRFSWFTRMTYGENRSMSPLVVVSSELSVLSSSIEHLPARALNASSNAYLFFTSASYYSLNGSAWSSGNSSTSFFLHQRSLRNLSEVFSFKMKVGTPNYSRNVMNACGSLCVKPSKRNFFLPGVA